MLRRHITLATAGLLLAASLTPAMAMLKEKRYHHNQHHYSQHYQHGYAERGYRSHRGIYLTGPGPGTAGVYAQSPYAGTSGCVPACRYDSNPCDPPYFKQADGRCNPVEHGGFF